MSREPDEYRQEMIEDLMAMAEAADNRNCWNREAERPTVLKEYQAHIRFAQKCRAFARELQIGKGERKIAIRQAVSNKQIASSSRCSWYWVRDAQSPTEWRIRCYLPKEHQDSHFAFTLESKCSGEWISRERYEAQAAIGPSSDDYERWLASRPAIIARFQKYPGFTQRTGYEIWRNAWLECERQHGIRNYGSCSATQEANK